MKYLFTFLLGFFLTNNVSADTTTLYFTSLNQPVQTITMHACDTLVIVNSSGYSYLLHDDTSYFAGPSDTIIDPQILSGNWFFGSGIFYDLTIFNDNWISIKHQVVTQLFLINLIPPPQSTITATICSGQSYLFDGLERTTTGIYTQSFPSLSYCDSLVHLDLTVLPPIQTTINASICSGQSYFFNGNEYAINGNYQDTVPTINECDSIVTLQLNVSPPLQSVINQTICIGTTFTFFGSDYTESGTYTHTLSTSNGCDSIVLLQLDVVPSLQTFLYESICFGDTYNFFGINYTVNGTYSHLLTTNTGCDSIITLELTVGQYINATINPINDTTLTASSAAVQANYNWLDCENNFLPLGITTQEYTASQNGSYAVDISSNGCHDTSSCVIISTIGLTEYENQSIILYPNPSSSGTIFIQSHTNLTSNKYEVLNTAGKIVTTGTLNSNTTTINLPLLLPGIYIIQIGNYRSLFQLQ